MSQEFQLKALAAYNERVQGLLNDGFIVMFSYQDETLVFVKLVHRNGNRVAVSLNLTNGRIKQDTNGKIVFTD